MKFQLKFDEHTPRYTKYNNSMCTNITCDCNRSFSCFNNETSVSAC